MYQPSVVICASVVLYQERMAAGSGQIKCYGSSIDGIYRRVICGSVLIKSVVVNAIGSDI